MGTETEQGRTAGLDAGSAVLEVGCGTGQLTEGLARYGFDLTAIDIGPSMIAAASQRLGSSGVTFQVASFESFTAAEASFDLVTANAGLFEPPLHVTDERRLVLPVETVIGVENTRATSLSWPAEVRQEFTEEMRRHLTSQTEVHLTQETSLTMARVPQS